MLCASGCGDYVVLGLGMKHAVSGFGLG